MIRPLARPTTGMCHSVVARSINASIRLTFFVIWSRGLPGSRPPAPCLAALEPACDVVREGVAAVGLTGLHDLARQRAADDRLHPARDGDERVEVDAGLDAHRVQAVDEVLRAHVAGGAGREGAAAEPTDRGVD